MSDGALPRPSPVGALAGAVGLGGVFGGYLLQWSSPTDLPVTGRFAIAALALAALIAVRVMRGDS